METSIKITDKQKSLLESQLNKVSEIQASLVQVQGLLALANSSLENQINMISDEKISLEGIQQISKSCLV